MIIRHAPGGSLQTTAPQMRPPVALLLAAGLGSRYDPTGNCLKLLQPMRTGKHTGVPIVAAAARNLKMVVEHTLAVVRPDTDRHQSQLHEVLRYEGCEIVVCEHANEGMGASLAWGVRAALDATGWIVALGDMPNIEPSTIEWVIQALTSGHAIAAPVYEGQRGHPVGFSQRCLDDLLTCNGDHGAHRVLVKFPPHLIAVNDGGILFDIDVA